jgi:peptide/nickel transport system substrate-binding protein
MLEGSDALDFSLPPARQRHAAGYVANRSFTLVRNPSWNASTDGLRAGYADRIEVSVGGEPEDVARRIDRGEFDVSLWWGPPPQLPADLVHAFLADPNRKDRVIIGQRDFVRYISLNLAVPPMDDIHVRRAISYAIDKQELVRTVGEYAGTVAGHLVLDSLENDILIDYHPYVISDRASALAAAKAEMRLSAYDADHDGVCDHAACRKVRALVLKPPSQLLSIADPVRRDLAAIGIDLDLQTRPAGQVFAAAGRPANKVPMVIGAGWGKDHLNASNFLTALAYGRDLGDHDNTNLSLVGASPAQLRGWGYSVASVPSVDANIRECLPLVGDAQTRCWAEADQQVMERVVPVVPYIVESNMTIVSSRVVSYSFDQFMSVPALDRIAVASGSSPG